MILLFFIDSDSDPYLGESISCDMEIDDMTTSGFDMDTIGELDIFFFESYSQSVIYTIPDSMLIESAEYFFSFSFECELELLPIEFFLYLKCLL